MEVGNMFNFMKTLIVQEFSTGAKNTRQGTQTGLKIESCLLLIFLYLPLTRFLIPLSCWFLNSSILPKPKSD